VVGYQADRTIAHTSARLVACGVPFKVLDISHYLETATVVEDAYRSPNARILLDGITLNFELYSGAYIRLIELREHRVLPREVAISVRRKMASLEQFFKGLPIRVMNRPGGRQSNTSKPFQLVELHAAGFRVPRSYSTNMPHAPGLAELISNGRLIYKSNSAMRSVVDKAGRSHIPRLSHLPNCPVLFQEYIAGPDVRVHLVGERTFGLQIHAKAVDYRYPGPFERVEYQSIEVPQEIGTLCRRFAEAEGLGFMGFDFKIAYDGTWHCLEANPMPGYDAFDERSDHCISDALIDELR
jgi:glutathione synthase/RimK-type ligase-like ATP-grasp enzyme